MARSHKQELILPLQFANQAGSADGMTFKQRISMTRYILGTRSGAAGFASWKDPQEKPAQAVPLRGAGGWFLDVGNVKKQEFEMLFRAGSGWRNSPPAGSEKGGDGRS